MTQELMLEILKDIQARVHDLQAQLRVELNALGQQLAGLTTAVYAAHDRFAEIERRMERIERRLDLTDTP